VVGLGSSWGPACGHPVEPGAQFCGVCGEPASAGALPPPSPGARQGWPPPPSAAQQVSPFSLASDTLPTELPSANGEDPWASWYGKPRAALPQDSSNLPDVYGAPTGYAEAPAYDGTQQYGAGQQYGGNEQYGQYVGPAEYGAGKEPYGATQQYGAGQQQGAGQQHGGSQPYGPGQQYTGGMAFGDQEYGGTAQYADFQQAGGRGMPGSPQRPRGWKSRGPLVPILAIGGVAAAAIAGLVIATSGSGGSSPSSVSSTPATTPAPAAAQKAAAEQLNALLSQGGNDHSDVVGAVLNVETCKSLRSARTTFATAATNRNNLLAKLGTLPNRSALPPALLADLTTAWQASAQADNDLHDWAQDLVSGGCHKGKTHDDQKYKDSLGPDSTASSAKARFSGEWQPLARKYGLPVYKTGAL
jgi:hypothetical protein